MITIKVKRNVRNMNNHATETRVYEYKRSEEDVRYATGFGAQSLFMTNLGIPHYIENSTTKTPEIVSILSEKGEEILEQTMQKIQSVSVQLEKIKEEAERNEAEWFEAAKNGELPALIARRKQAQDERLRQAFKKDE